MRKRQMERQKASPQTNAPPRANDHITQADRDLGNKLMKKLMENNNQKK